MKILFYVINYNVDKYVYKFIDSVYGCNIKSDWKFEIHVIDNSQKNQQQIIEIRDLLNRNGVEYHFTGSNLGYFGCIPYAQALLNNHEVDCVVFCNPDLQLDKNFFTELHDTLNFKGIIAPSIISLTNGFDQNPKYIRRLSKIKLQFLRIVFSNVVVGFFYSILAKAKEFINRGRQKTLVSHDSKLQNIYAPHGAMFIFTDVSFFKNLKQYPCFLFGEEIFIAEEAIKSNVKIWFNPRIRVYDIRHASVSSLKSSYIWKLHNKSINFLLKSYY